MADRYFHPQTDWFNKRGLTPPETVSHGTEEDIRANLKSVNPTNWHMEGAGQLVADTDLGRLVQFVGTDYICEGTDSKGLPIFKKL